MNKTKNILVIGTGSIGERHVRCMQNTKRVEVGICEPDSQLRQRIAEQYHIDAAFESLEQALSQKFDAAVIAVPANLHIKLALQCAQAGLALLIEKPLAVDPESVAPLMEVIKQKNLVASVAYVYRAHPALGQMRQAIIDGEFGKPLELIAINGQNFPTYRPAYASTYYKSHETGGGAIQDALTHVLNAGEWLVGPITRLTVDGAHMALKNVEVEDTVHVIARHGNIPASYALNQHQFANESSLTVVCEEATVRFDLANHLWQVMTEPDGQWQVHKTNFHQRDDWFTAQEDAFLEALDGKAKPLCTLEEGLQTLKVNVAALQSVEQDGAMRPIEN